MTDPSSVKQWSVSDLVAAYDYMSRELTVAEWYDEKRRVISTELHNRIGSAH